MANVVVVLNLNHFRGNGVGISIDLDGGKEVVGKHFDDGVIIRVKVRVRVGDSFEKGGGIGLGGAGGVTKQTVLVALLKIRAGVSVEGVLGIVEVIGIVSSFLDLTDVTKVGRWGPSSWHGGVLKMLLDTRLEKIILIWVLFNVVRHNSKKVFKDGTC